MTPNDAARIIEARIGELPVVFETRDCFAILGARPGSKLRGYACMALRQLEAKGMLACVGRGSYQVNIWKKTEAAK